MMASRAERPGRFVVSDAIFWPADLAMMVGGRKERRNSSNNIVMSVEKRAISRTAKPKSNSVSGESCLIGERG